MIRCYIALGSNLGEPRQQLASALHDLGLVANTQLVECSPWYRSPAVGPGEQPDYLNAVASIDTTLEPMELLRALQDIENKHGRQREVRWGARTLDLDILLYGNQQIDSPTLTVPHPRMTVRDFVLYPLNDIAPDVSLPCGTTLASLLTRCPKQKLQLTGDMSDSG
jgi:2-amino-4-hydroxy-6-hydroxymethyldihydropteridine diphosphokinase